MREWGTFSCFEIYDRVLPCVEKKKKYHGVKSLVHTNCGLKIAELIYDRTSLVCIDLGFFCYILRELGVGKQESTS